MTLVEAAIAGDRAAAIQLARSFADESPDQRDVMLDRLGAAAAAGSQPALDLVVQLVHESRFARAEIRQYILDDGEAEEVLQDVLIAVARSIGGFRGDAKLRTWVTAIARNTSLSALRRKRATLGREGDVADEFGEVARFSSELASRQDLHAALDRLPSDFAAVVRLRDLEHRPYNEIAELLGVKLNTVRSRLARGRARLVQELMA